MSQALPQDRFRLACRREAGAPRFLVKAAEYPWVGSGAKYPLPERRPLGLIRSIFSAVRVGVLVPVYRVPNESLVPVARQFRRRPSGRRPVAMHADRRRCADRGGRACNLSGRTEHHRRGMAPPARPSGARRFNPLSRRRSKHRYPTWMQFFWCSTRRSWPLRCGGIPGPPGTPPALCSGIAPCPLCPDGGIPRRR